MRNIVLGKNLKYEHMLNITVCLLEECTFKIKLIKIIILMLCELNRTEQQRKKRH